MRSWSLLSRSTGSRQLRAQSLGLLSLGQCQPPTCSWDPATTAEPLSLANSASWWGWESTGQKPWSEWSCPLGLCPGSLKLNHLRMPGALPTQAGAEIWVGGPFLYPSAWHLWKIHRRLCFELMGGLSPQHSLWELGSQEHQVTKLMLFVTLRNHQRIPDRSSLTALRCQLLLCYYCRQDEGELMLEQG